MRRNYNHLRRTFYLILFLPGMGTSIMMAQSGVQGMLTIQPLDNYQTVVGFGASLAYYEIRKESLGQFPSGDHRVIIQREDIPAGLYLFKLENSRGEGRFGRLIIQD